MRPKETDAPLSDTITRGAAADQRAPKYATYGPKMAERDANQRKHMKDSDFAEPEERKYPMEDKTHARNALSRVAQNGSKEEQEEVREHVEKKYPSLKKD